MDDRVVKMIGPEYIDSYVGLIELFLEEQLESISPFYTIDEYIDLMRQGMLIPWIYFYKEEPIGLVVLSRQLYTPTVRSVKIEFLSCKNLYRMRDVLPLLEEFCRKHGYTYLEAIAHPVIAEYGAKKHGFRVPSVYIRKTISYERSN